MTAGSRSAAGPGGRVEGRRRLSQSDLWQWQHAYFTQEALTPWSTGAVPQHITSNPLMARAYAQMITAWLSDSADEPPLAEPGGPVHILEIGAGSGQLAFNILRTLHKQTAAPGGAPYLYVMTDINPERVEAWREHPQLQRFVTDGLLDFAVLDIERDTDVSLVVSGNTLEAGTLEKPLIVVANYVFDSLPQDAFKIESGELFELVVDNDASMEQLPITERFATVDLSLVEEPAAAEPYEDPLLNAILADYLDMFTATHLLFPTGAFACLDLVRSLATGTDLLVLAADKGNHIANDLDFRDPPTMAIHGSFSLPVNFDAIGRYTLLHGGTFLSTSYRPISLDVCAMLFPGRAKTFPSTREAYERYVEESNPADFSVLKRSFADRYASMSSLEIIALLRLSSWDSSLFLAAYPALLEGIADAEPELKAEVCLAAYNVWHAYYFIDEEQDVAFALGLVMLAIGSYHDALGFFGISLKLHGPDPSTHYFLGVCHEAFGDLSLALDCAREALELDPGFEPARFFERELLAGLSLS